MGYTVVDGNLSTTQWAQWRGNRYPVIILGFICLRFWFEACEHYGEPKDPDGEGEDGEGGEGWLCCCGCAGNCDGAAAEEGGEGDCCVAEGDPCAWPEAGTFTGNDGSKEEAGDGK